MRILIALCCLLALCSCTKTAPPFDPIPFDGAYVAHFGVLVSQMASPIPLQGELAFSHDAGSLTLILPHGLTLGSCTYAKEADGLVLHCQPNGDHAQGGMLLRRLCRAFVRIAGSLVSRTDVTTKQWSVRYHDGKAVFSDKDLSFSLHSLEVSQQPPDI